MILLAAGVIIFLGVAGEAFFKRTGIPEIVFFIIMASVVITTIGLGKAKNIPPPENVEGGYVKNVPHEGDQTSKNGSQTVTKYD